MLYSKYKSRTLFLLVIFQIHSGSGYSKKEPTVKDFGCENGKCIDILYSGVVSITIASRFTKGDQINVHAEKDNFLLVTIKGINEPKENDFMVVSKSLVGKKKIIENHNNIRDHLQPTKTVVLNSPQHPPPIIKSSIDENNISPDSSYENVEPGTENEDDYEESLEVDPIHNFGNPATDLTGPDTESIIPTKPNETVDIRVDQSDDTKVEKGDTSIVKKTKEINDEVIIKKQFNIPEDNATGTSSEANQVNNFEEQESDLSSAFNQVNKPEEEETSDLSSAVNHVNKPEEEEVSDLFPAANQFNIPEESANDTLSEDNQSIKPEEQANELSSAANQVNISEEAANDTLVEDNQSIKSEEQANEFSSAADQVNISEEAANDTLSEDNASNKPEEKPSYLSSETNQINKTEEQANELYSEAKKVKEPEEKANDSSSEDKLSIKPEEQPNELTSTADQVIMSEEAANGTLSEDNRSIKPEEQANELYSEAKKLNKPEQKANGSSSEDNQSINPEEQANYLSSEAKQPIKPGEERNGHLSNHEQTITNNLADKLNELPPPTLLSSTFQPPLRPVEAIKKSLNSLPSESSKPSANLDDLATDFLQVLEPESEQKEKFISASEINESPSPQKSAQIETVIDSIAENLPLTKENILPDESVSGIPILYESWENLQKVLESLLSDYLHGKEINSALFSEYPSLVLLFNSTLLLCFILLLNCLSIKKCDSTMKGKLYMIEKKLLEKKIEDYKVSDMINENDKIKQENHLHKDKLNKLSSKISQLQDEEIVLKKSLDEYRTKYESLEEASNKKNIKKNYELLMGEVIVQKKKLDELAAGMEERAESLKQEKTNIESLLKIQAEEHGKIVNDYRMLLGNLELENKELRDIVQTLSTDSDATQKLLEAVTLQVQLCNLEKENENLTHQLDGEREAHKLLEDHQRMTQKEVNDLRESYEVSLKEKKDLSNKLKYITDYFQQLEDKLKKEIAVKDDLLNEKLGDDDSLAKALMNLRKDNSVLTEENNILRNKYESLKVELTDQKNEDKLSKTKLEYEREQIWMAWRAAERKIESLNLDNKVLRSKLVTMGSKSETSFREMHTQTYEDRDKNLSRTSSLYMDHTSPVPQPFMPNYAIPLPLLSDEEMRQLYDPTSGNFDENGHNGYQTDEDHSFPSNDYRLPPLGGGTYSPPTLDNIPVPNIPLPLDNDVLWKLQKMTDPINNSQAWNMSSIEPSNDDEGPSYKNSPYSRKRAEDSISSVSSSRRSFV